MGKLKNALFDELFESEYEEMYPYEQDFKSWVAAMEALEIEEVNSELQELANEARERAIGEVYGTA